MRKSLQAWNILLGVSMVAMVALWIWDVVTPRPSFKVTGARQAKDEGRLRAQGNELRERARQDKLVVEARLWSGDPELIGPSALAVATRIAQSHGLRLAAFRPQKSIVEGSLERFPYLISLEGAYPRVQRFVKDMERFDNRLVVNMVQVASSDGASSNVTATVGVWALRAAPVAPKSTTKGRTTRV